MKKLKRQDLFCTKCYLNGEWADAADKSTLNVDNPATGEILGTVPNCKTKETKKVIDDAHTAFKIWKKLTPKERGAYLVKWYNLIEENKEDLARILTLEQGKPIAESLGEIALGNSYMTWFAEEGKRAYGQTIPAPRPGIRPITYQKPVGVVFAITPWNFPISLVLRKIAPALAAGCTIVVKPAGITPFSAIALFKLAEEAGIPKGVVNIITGNAKVIGEEVCTNPKVRKISFTGSTPVGKAIMAKATCTMKRFSMELGGNAPFVMFDDANMDHAINCAIGSKFRNAGQTCVSTNRFIIQKGICDKFIATYKEQFPSLVVAEGTDPSSIIGPLVNQEALDNIESLVADAVAKGAKIVLGGKKHALGGLFFEPTLILGMTKEMRIYKEEIFGPIAAIMTFETEEEAIELANDTEFGLASYLMTTDLGRAWRVAESLEYGLVGINDAGLALCEAPFGGVKESGMGKEGAHEGLLDYMETRYALMGGIGA